VAVKSFFVISGFLIFMSFERSESIASYAKKRAQRIYPAYFTVVLHFPVIQLLLYAGWFQESPWYFLMTVILITMGSAIAMWHFVEKRFLFRKSYYITANFTPVA
jgi:peptidoglycan/LPS O-acetylase OafA/YrhL